MGRLLIFDTTLRDGVKSPGTILTVEEKLRIAKQLSRLGVDVLEAGFPAASEEEFESVERIAGDVEGPVITVLARATNPRDFEIAWKAVKDSARPRIHTFVPISREYREHFLKKGVEDTIKLAISAIEMARKYVTDVEFSLVDAFRADPSDVIKMVQEAARAGAKTVNLADTIGCAVPSDFTQLFERLRQEGEHFDNLVFSVHCHNDLGLAVANSLAAIVEGARQVHCTINGIGERAGNAAMEELVAALHTRRSRFNLDTGIRLDQIHATSRLVKRLAGINLQPHKPVVGSNAFFYEAVVPQLADSHEKPPYEIMSPERLGIQPMGGLLSSESTSEEFQRRVAELGYFLEDGRLEECYQAFRELVGKKEQVLDDDIELLVNLKAETKRIRYRLRYLSVTAGSISVPHATVQLEVEGNLLQDTGFGQGPVDASFKTIFKIAKRFPKLVKYEVNAVTPGTDAQGEVTVRLEDNGRLVDGRAVDTDIVLASARALVDGLNKLEYLRVQPSISEFTDEESWMPRL